jgi:hypothetical protein
MAAPSPAANCPIRARLLADYKRCNDHYNRKLAELLNVMSAEEAIERVHKLYGVAIEARKALQQHEGEHGCALAK